MLSPKRTQITAASDTFGQEEREDWLPLLAGSRTYREASQNFVDLETKLNGISTGTRKAKQLNATYVLLDKIGPVAAGAPSSEGEYSTQENREGLLDYALSVLYGTAFVPRFTTTGSTRVRTVPVW
jgi:hypothetical protein